MNIYRITVRETNLVEYSIEADSEEEARDLLHMFDQRIVRECGYWHIIKIEEYI